MQDGLPTISIVTPSFNQGDFLERTMRSILDQKYPNLEYVVMDGGSKDQSPQLIEQYRDRLTWGVSEKDGGHADAINKGFAKTTGEIMAWLNSDDLYYPWTLQVVAEVFAKYPEIEWITGVPTVWNGRDQPSEVHRTRTTVNRWDFLAGHYKWIPQESTFWRRSLWEKAGGRMDDGGILMIDGELWSRFFDHAELWRVETILGGYRMHGLNRAHAEPGRVDEEMERFCREMFSRASVGDRLLVSECRALRKRSRSTAAAHLCSRYPVVRWDAKMNDWVKDEVRWVSEWPDAPNEAGLKEIPAPKVQPPARMPDGSPWPRITVVTPSYQQGRYLEGTLQSVADQGYPDVEHIVIDGGSTDGSVDILKKWDDKLTHWVSEPDGGQSDALNKGFARATGQILTWLNSDDRLAPGALHAVALAFFEQPQADLVAGVVDVEWDGRIVHRHLRGCADGALPLDGLLDIDGSWLPGRFFYQPEVFFRRELWERAGACVRKDLRYSMDYELWVHYGKAGAQLKVIGRTLAIFREHEAQKTDFQCLNFKEELRAVAAEHGAIAPSEIKTNARPSLRIAMLNDIGYRYGAGIAHGRIGQGLAQAGHDVRAFAVAADTPEPSELEGAADRLIENVLDWEPDVILVGSLHNAGLMPRDLAKLPESLPMVVCMHDLWWITGRCAYSGDCGRLFSEVGCNAQCPTATEYPQLESERIAGAYREKREFLTGKGRRVLVAANSGWTQEMLGRAEQGFQEGRERSAVIHFAPDPEVFRPRDPVECRRMFGLPKDAFIVIFSASDVADRRKGLKYLADALAMLGDREVVPICLGHAAGVDTQVFAGLRSFGYVDSPALQARLLAAADAFVGLSVEEAYGQVFVEAACCGTPSIGFDVGGVSDALRDGVTGLLVREVGAGPLAEAIRRLKNEQGLLEAFRWQCIVHAGNEFTPEANYRRIHRLLEAAAGTEHPLAPKIGLAPTLPPLPPLQLAAGGMRSASEELTAGLMNPLRKEDFERLQYFYFRDQWKNAGFIQRLHPLTLAALFGYKGAKRRLKASGSGAAGEAVYLARGRTEVAVDVVEYFTHCLSGGGLRERKPKGWRRFKIKLLRSAIKARVAK